MNVNWESVRAEFPALARWTYLNTATFGQMPARAVLAVERHFARRGKLACSDFLSWFDDADRLRGLLARLIHAQPGDIAFVPNAATGLGLLMGGLDWRPGDRIVTLENEFPNSIYAPALERRRGVEFVEAPWERFLDAINGRTRLVLLSEVNYTNGFRPPLEQISRRAREQGALLYVDGTQSLGALQFDLRAVALDMYVAHGYKWLLSPNGAAFMYVAPELRERLEPQAVGWRSHRAWREVASLHHGAPEFVSEAEKYEGGMLPSALLYAMEASVGMILELGPAAIEQRVMRLAGYARDRLRQLGARLPFDESPHFDSPVVAARFPKPAALLAQQLKARQVLVSARHDNLRVSTHFYNNEQDVDRLAAELKTLL
jgi:selenocysteine lyase/cysteine desulfurase